MSHFMHDNSLKAYREIHGAKARKEIVLKVYERFPAGVTDWEVARILGYGDPNKVRPRITELLKNDRLLTECGKQADQSTGRTCRVLRILTPAEIRDRDKYEKSDEYQMELFRNARM